MTYIANRDFILEVQKGNVPKHSIMKGFGERESGTTNANGEDVWRGNELNPKGDSSIPIPPDAGHLMTVTSEANADKITGTGVQKIEIQYITPSGTPLTTIIETNGGSVDTGISMRFVQEMTAIQVGSNGAAKDHIKIHQTGDDSVVYNMISKGSNQSMTTNRMVPLGSTLYIQEWDCSENQGKRTTFRIRATSKDGVINPRIFTFSDVCSLNKSTSPTMHVYMKVPALAIVKVSEWNDQSGVESSASWWGILVQD